MAAKCLPALISTQNTYGGHQMKVKLPMMSLASVLKGYPLVCKRTTVYDKFLLDKIFAKPSYLCIAEIFNGINFCQCGKGCHILNVIINTGQKICMIKISPIRADGKISQNFLLAKISTYTVCYS